jgi:hypothetical protein
MNSERAKFVLGAYRPNHADQDDPEMGEALALAREDEELRQWLDDQVKFDRGVMECLREIVPSPDLYQNILHGVRVSRAGAGGEKVIGRLWSWPGLRAMAAVLLLGLFVGAMIWAPWNVKDRSDVYASLNCRDCAVEVIDDLHAGVAKLDLRTQDVSEVKAFLKASHSTGLSPEEVDLQAVKPMGCKKIKSRTGTVTIVCFRQEGTLYHLATFEIRNPASNDLPSADDARFTHHGHLVAATWREGEMGRMLLSTQGEANEEDLARLLGELTV